MIYIHLIMYIYIIYIYILYNITYPFPYENKKKLREFKEKSFIMRWKPQLNTYQ